MPENAIVLDSPIEFALVGPRGSRDVVLVRSHGAGLDLLGVAHRSHRRGTIEGQREDLLSILYPWSSAPAHIVESFPLADLKPDFDSRLSRFKFVWRGFASSRNMDRIEEQLKLQLPDLHRAVSAKSVDEIAWAIAPIVYACAQANEVRLRTRMVMWATLTSYAFLTVVALFILIYIKL